MDKESPYFSPWDYVMFVLVLVISSCIGLYYGCTGGKQKTTKEFLMANRSMNWVPVTLSLLASFMSAITLLGTPSEIYNYGTQYWFIWVGYCIMIPLAAHVYLPIFFNLHVTSVFEYLQMRFNTAVRIAGAITFIVQMTLYMSIVLYAPALALNAVTGLNVWLSVFSVGVVCTFYTAIGGMKAVMWTDTFQIVCMFAGLFAVIIKGSIDKGGFGEIWEINRQGGRFEWWNFNPDPTLRHTWWTLSFGGCFTWLAVYGVNQAQIQRALTVPKLKHAQLAMWLNLPGLTALLTVCSLCGMVVYAQYKDCDPILQKRIQKADQLLPRYVMDSLGGAPGVPGLFTACIFSGALSTLSSGLNGLAAVTLQDMVKICFPNLTDHRATILSKIMAVLYGILCISLTFVAAQLGGVLQAALALFGMIGGPLLGLFTLGMLYPCANSKGAMVGLVVSLMFTFWLGIGAQFHKAWAYKPPVSIAGCGLNETSNVTTLALQTVTSFVTTAAPEARKTGILRFYEISYLWYSACAVLIVTVVGLIVSVLTGGAKQAKHVDPKLLCPIFDVFCCYLPASCRRKLACDKDHENKWEDEKTLQENGEVYTVEKGTVNPAAEKTMDSTWPYGKYVVNVTEV